MTVVVGVEHAQGVVIGADSAGVSGWAITPRADEKVFTRQSHGLDWAFGFAGSFRVGQLVRYALEIPEPPSVLRRNARRSALTDAAVDDRWARYMATDFVDAVRVALKNGGAREERYEVHEAASHGQFLVGVAGRLFAIYADFQVGRSRFPWEAIGCGRDEARGALYALSDHVGHPEHGEDARRWAHCALRAADSLNGGVCDPYEIVEARS